MLRIHQLTAKFFFACLLLPLLLQAQNDSCDTRISLLTATPGEELYSTFGHSALRVKSGHSDLVYNYGTFHFDEPGFYMKFVKGKLMYFLSVEDFPSFMSMYEYEGRGITEQVLDLSCSQKQKILEMLRQNSLPQNKYYKYDFLFDNCTTRLRDLIEGVDSSVHFRPVLHSPRTFRNLIHSYLDINHKAWSKLGIDLLLGAKTDRVMTKQEVMFLPDYLMESVDGATVDSLAILKEKKLLLNASSLADSKNNLTTPLFIFICLFAVIALLSFSKSPTIHQFLMRLDALVFFITGLLGCFFLFMWFGTDHAMTKNNYNLLWAWPVNIVFAFFIQQKRAWVRTYLYIFAIFNLILIILWFGLPQQLNVALIPLVGILVFRSFVRASSKKNVHGNNTVSK